MGDFLKRVKAAIVADEGDLNPKLQPPMLVGVLFCLISMFCFICSMVAFNLGPVTLIVCMAVVVLYGAIGTGEGSAWERGYPSTTFLVPIGIGSVLLPLYIGVKIFVGIYAPYYLAVSGRHYENVSPLVKTAVYADAGVIRFTSDATLDTARSFGFKADDFTYCAAPVVSKSAAVHPDSAGPMVSFWAVGKDCCGNRREFECDGAGETEVQNAFTVSELEKDWLTKLLVPRTSRPMYLKAVEAAKAIHNLQSENDDKIILVRWASQPEKILEVWHNRAIIAVIISCITYAVIITVLWGSIHMYFDRDIQKLAHTKYMADRSSFNPFMVNSP